MYSYTCIFIWLSTYYSVNQSFYVDKYFPVSLYVSIYASVIFVYISTTIHQLVSIYLSVTLYIYYSTTKVSKKKDV